MPEWDGVLQGWDGQGLGWPDGGIVTEFKTT